MKKSERQVIVLGDSYNNTLGLIRSLGEAKIDTILILMGQDDRLCVAKSRYLQKDRIYKVPSLSDCLSILLKIHDTSRVQFLICSNDPAAEFVDLHEDMLSNMYITPMRGKHFGNIQNKDSQCRLALDCGFTVPQSVVYTVGEDFPKTLTYPVLLKPLNSNNGTKNDIHICKNMGEVQLSLTKQSDCKDYIVQEYIEKEYEINLIGISTEKGVFVPGGIQKIRHYPTIYSPCSFGLFQKLSNYNIDLAPIQAFISKVGYYGPFSVEFLHKNNRNYFMEFNFRHDGLAYAATASGCNLLDVYVNGKDMLNVPHDTYMMDLSLDYNHVKDKHINFRNWLRDFLKTSCQLNFNWRDPFPTFSYYFSKIKKHF